MAFLNSKTQEKQSEVKRKKDVHEEPDEQLHERTEEEEKDGRPDYQLLFMSSWLLGDYWTFVWKTFGLDGPKAWEGSSQTFTTLKVNLFAFNFSLRLYADLFSQVTTVTSIRPHLFTPSPSFPSCCDLTVVAPSNFRQNFPGTHPWSTPATSATSWTGTSWSPPSSRPSPWSTPASSSRGMASTCLTCIGRAAKIC